MTQEEKELLLKDICARLPYGVKILDDAFKKYGASELINIGIDGSLLVDNKENDIQYYPIIDDIKPYLRPMSSMTEEEKKEFTKVLVKSQECSYENNESATTIVNDWYLSKGFDVRGLIPKGLAIEAPEDMYK